MTPKQLDLKVDGTMAGRTLASILREAAGLSHARSKGLILSGQVSVNGRPATEVARRLAAGDRIEASLAPAAARKGRARPVGGPGFRVLFEDPDLVVVEKHPGLLVVPAAPSSGEALVDRLLSMYASRGFRAPRLWVVHRIDRFTSGLVLFARTGAAAANLIAQFAARTALREYLAICEGIPPRPEGRLESLLAQKAASHQVLETSNRKLGRRASCRYRVLRRLKDAAFVQVTLETGRKNQIRVQFAGIGHPLLGDRTYGTRSPLIPRVALHAARLAFFHPKTGRRMTLESALPSDMNTVLRKLRP